MIHHIFDDIPKHICTENSTHRIKFFERFNMLKFEICAAAAASAVVFMNVIAYVLTLNTDSP